MKKDDIILVYYIDVRNMSMQNIQEVLFQVKIYTAKYFQHQEFTRYKKKLHGNNELI